MTLYIWSRITPFQRFISKMSMPLKNESLESSPMDSEWHGMNIFNRIIVLSSTSSPVSVTWIGKIHCLCLFTPHSLLIVSRIPIPIAYSLYLYRYRSKREYMDFAFTFLLTNLLGFIIYYIIPTAYVTEWKRSSRCLSSSIDPHGTWNCMALNLIFMRRVIQLVSFISIGSSVFESFRRCIRKTPMSLPRFHLYTLLIHWSPFCTVLWVKNVGFIFFLLFSLCLFGSPLCILGIIMWLMSLQVVCVQWQLFFSIVWYHVDHQSNDFSMDIVNSSE